MAEEQRQDAIQDPSVIGTSGLQGLKSVEQQRKERMKRFEAYRQMADYPITMQQVIDTQTDPTPQGISDLYPDVGKSRYDDAISTSIELQHIEDTRSKEQSAAMQFISGAGKMASLAGTTFLDGTVGLVYGVGSAIWHRDYSKLWDNEISNGLQWWNDRMEEWLPNYRTDEERNRAWYQNLGTMNFWADSFLKNVGFIVGATYSSMAWTKALKAAGALTKSMGAQLTGSFLSAVNEGRIEANNHTRNMRELETKKFSDARDKALMEIQENPDYSPEEKTALSEMVKENYEKEMNELETRVQRSGLMDLLANIPLLMFDHLYTYGKLYSRGFKQARSQASGRVTKQQINEGMKTVSEKELGKRVVREGNRYGYDKITTGQALWRGVSRMAVEGNEEMGQAFIDATSGHYFMYDNPDAYYDALTDPSAEKKTNGMWTSAIKGWHDSYGDPNRWEEFAVAALTQLLGTPTFGKVQNADANTWLGQGKFVGLSGGVYGEIKNARQENKEMQEAVDYMNNYMQDWEKKKRHFAQSVSFTEAMDGFAADDNKFEYKNAEDNEDFAAISRFARTGHLQDLKEMVNQDFQGMSDEEIDAIARNTEDPNNPRNPNIGFKNADGSDMTSDQIRAKLEEKKKDILKRIDQYGQSLEKIRAIGNDSINEDEILELAWLDWKTKRFSERLGEMKDEDKELFKKMNEALQDYRSQLISVDINEVYENGEIKKSSRELTEEEIPKYLSEEKKKELSTVDFLIDYLTLLNKSKDALQLASFIGADSKLFENLGRLDDFVSDKIGMDANDFKKTISDLADTGRLATAAKEFNDRIKKYTDDPLGVRKNRERIDKEKAETKAAQQENQEKSDRLRRTPGETAKNIVDGKETIENLNRQDEVSEDQKKGINLVQKANALVNPGGILDNLLIKYQGDQIKKEIIEVIRGSIADAIENSPENIESLLDSQSEFWQDPSNYILSVNLQKMSEDEIELYRARAQEIIDEISGLTDDQINELAEMGRNYRAQNRSNARQISARTDQGVPVAPAAPSTPSESGQGNRGIFKNPRQQAGKDKESVTPAVNQPETPEERQMREEEERRYHLEKGIDTSFGNEEEKAVAAIRLEEMKKAYKTDIDAIAKAYYNSIVRTYLNLKKNYPEYTDRKIIEEIQARHNVLLEDNSLVDVPAYLIQDLIERDRKYMESRKKEASDNGGQVPDIAPQESQKIEEEAPVSASSETVPAYSVTRENMEKEASSRENQTDTSLDETKVWKITTTEYPIHKERGDNRPFYEIAQKMGYDDRTKKRIEIISKFLKSEGAFERQNTMSMKVGDKVGFMISTKLNEELSKATGQDEIAIFYVHEDGNVIGDVMDKADPRISRQPGLKEFIERVEKEYKAWRAEGNTDDAFISKETTSISHLMVGKISYTKSSEFMNRVSDLAKRSGAPVKIGIMIPLKDKSAIIMSKKGKDAKLNAEESSIMQPLNMLPVGATYLLIPTNNPTKKYIAVPFQVGNFYASRENSENPSKLTSVISALLDILKTEKGREKTLDVKKAIQKYLNIPTLYIGLNDRSQIVINYSPEGFRGTRQILFEGDPKDLKSSIFNGVPINISLDMINSKLKDGSFYNDMIAEEGYVNIDSLSMYNGWFAVNPIDAKGREIPAIETGFHDRKTPAPEAPSYQKKNEDKPDISNTDKSGKKLDPELENTDLQDQRSEIPAQPVAQPTVKTLTLQERFPKYRDIIDQLSVETREALSKLEDNQLKDILLDISSGVYGDFKDITIEDLDLESDNPTDDEKPDTPLREVEPGRQKKTGDLTKETEWLGKALPQFSNPDRLMTQKGIIKIGSSENPTRAYGMFKGGVIILSDQAALGTVYHEAFHAVVRTLLSDKELSEFYKAAKERYPSLTELQAEERLAEEFRRYMQINDLSVIGTLARIFRKIKAWLGKITGKEMVLDTMFRRIQSGYYADRKIPTSYPIDNLQGKRLDYEILDSEEKGYLKEKEISRETYDAMSSFEREVLFRCRH